MKDNKEVFETQKKMAMLSENMRKQAVQLNQTKSLLQVVQDQRKHLMEENSALRNELDEVLSRSLRIGDEGERREKEETEEMIRNQLRLIEEENII